MGRLGLLGVAATVAATVGAWAVLAGAGCFFDPELGSGRVRCAVDGSCPDARVCGGDGLCYQAGAPITVRITLDPPVAATVAATTPGLSCSAGVCTVETPAGVALALTLVPAAGYHLTAWDGCTATEGAPLVCTLVPAAGSDVEVRATFEALGGNTLWLRHFGGDAVDESYAIATGPVASPLAGKIRVGGGFSSAAISLGEGADIANLGEAGTDDGLVSGFAITDGANDGFRTIGGAGYENVWHVAIDVVGGTYAAGYIEGTVDLGGGPRTVAEGYDGFVAAYDPAGLHLWDRVFACGGVIEDEVNSVTTDENGDVFVSGSFAGACDLGDGVVRLGGGGSPFVVKLDGTTGATLWARHFPIGAGGTGEALRVAAAVSGDVVVAGSFRVSLEASASDTLLSDGATEDIFALRLGGETGTTVWALRFGGPGSDWANSVAVDGDGNAYLTGRFQATVTFGAEPRSAVGLSDVFLIKLSSGGGLPAWDLTFGSDEDDDGYGVAIDYANGEDVVVAGGIGGNVDFGAGFVLTAQGQDGFAARFGSDGAGPLWVRQYGGAQDDAVYDVAIAPGAGHEVLLVGSFRDTADFGGAAFVATSAGEEDTFVLAISP